MTRRFLKGLAGTVLQDTPPPRTWNRSLVMLAGAVTLVAFLAVDTYPVVGNDGIAYLRHSQGLGEYGLVKLGYRQFGYPLWLTIWSWVGAALEPLALTSLVQRLLWFAVVWFALWKVPAAGVVLLGLLLAPSFVGYSNHLLTEAIGVPLAVLSAILICILVDRAHRTRPGGEPQIGAGLILATCVVAMALAMVRFHYLLLSGAALGTLLFAVWGNARSRKVGLVAVSIVGLLMGLMFWGMAVENEREYDEFFPTVRGERVRFWALWQVAVVPNAPLIEQELPGIYLDGNPYTYIAQIDAKPHDEAKVRYEESSEEILDVLDTSIWQQRLEATVGALAGARVDDNLVGSVLGDVLPGELNERIHRNTYSRENGIEAFNENFNAGRVTRAGLISSGPIPQIPLPHISALCALLIPLSAAVLLGGLFLRRARKKATVGLVVLAAYTALSGWFVLDVLRFLLPAYVAVVVLASATLVEIYFPESRLAALDRGEWQLRANDSTETTNQH